MRRTWVSAGIAAFSLPLFAASQSTSTCLLHTSDPGSYTATECIACHRQGGGATPIAFAHPVDLDYASRQAAKASSLRPAADVVAMGVPLPSGMLRCATCHTDRSPWPHYIRLPNGATARTHVTPDQPESRTAQPGDEISPTPLCKACHSF